MTKTDDLLSLMVKVLIDTQIRNPEIVTKYQEMLNKINGRDKTKRSR